MIEYVKNENLKLIKPDFAGNIRIDGRFSNSLKQEKAPLTKVLKWLLTPNPQRSEKKADTFRLTPYKDTTFLQNEDDCIIWLGHATFFIRLDGVSYLSDPIFSNMPSYKRRCENPYEIDELGKIDYVLISHAHFDHCDLPSLKRLAKANPSMQILAPLGLGRILKSKHFKDVIIKESGWFQAYDTPKNQVSFLPANHWYRRTAWDFNKILWGSYAIQSSKKSIYFAGDTAKHDEFFKQINEVFPSFDLCLMPIGAYSPAYMMQNHHLNPKEAIDMFKILKGKRFVPMHYGTYELSDEPISEPIRLAREYLAKQNLQESLLELKLGENFYL